MKASGLTPTELGEKAGYGRGPAAYQRVYPYLTGKRPMGPKVQKDLARALDVPLSTFADPDRAALKIARAEAVYDAFLATEDGDSADDGELAAIRRILPTLYAPSVNVLKAVLFALRGQGSVPSVQDGELNEMLDRANEAKRPKKKG